MAEWVDEGDSTYTLTVGSLRATVQPYAFESFEWRIRHTSTHDTLERWTAPLPLDEAKAAAEQALREMHAALAEHFAPVLRWQQLPSGWLAEFGCWSLYARQNRWTIRQETAPNWCRDVTSSPSMTSGYRADEEQARRHAEAVLRSFGVVFRTEGE